MKRRISFILIMAFVLSNVPFTAQRNGDAAAAAEYVEMYDEEYVYGDFVFDVYHTPSWEYYVGIKGYCFSVSMPEWSRKKCKGAYIGSKC